MTLLQMSISGAVLILIITVIRALAVHRLPKQTFLILWTIVVLRLLVPVSIPSVLSVYSLLRQTPLQAQIPETPPSQLPALGATVQGLPNVVPVSNTSPETASVSVGLLLWGAGVFLCLSFFVAVYLRCRIEFRMALPVENEFTTQWCETHRLRRTICIRQLDKISAPLTYGVLHPVILMPKTTNWTSEPQLEYILLHEYIHICRLDAVKKLILTLTVCLHWFNPMVWVLYVLYNRDVELYCDERVMHLLDGDVRAEYARTLIAMEETKSGLGPLCSGFSKTAIEERIRAIMKMKKVSVGAIFAAIILVVGVTTVFATSAATAEEMPAVSVCEAGEAMVNTDPQVSELLKEYEPFGITEKNGNLYYHGELVRWFLDGYERDENVISRYEAYNSNGTVDVHTVREDKQNQDGSTELFGPIKDIAAYSREEFEQREFSFVTTDEAVVVEESAVVSEADSIEDDAAFTEVIQAEAVAVRSDEQTEIVTGETAYPGSTVPEHFRKYASVGIDYTEEKGKSGRGNVYYNGKPVKVFVDISPTGVFSYQSVDGGTINVQTVYDKSGNLTGIKVLSDMELEDVQIHMQVYQEVEEEWKDILEPYVPYGLSYIYEPTGENGEGDVTMMWQGKEIRGIMDEETGIWITEHAGRTTYSSDAVELYAVYKNGSLAGLREATEAEMNEWNTLRDQAKQWEDTAEG